MYMYTFTCMYYTCTCTCTRVLTCFLSNASNNLSPKATGRLKCSENFSLSMILPRLSPACLYNSLYLRIDDNR